MSFLFNRHRKGGIPRNATFRLTQEGREKLQEFSGDTKSRIMMAMETRGVSLDTEEIADASGVSRGQVEKTIPALIHGGYIQYVSSSLGAETD